MKPLEVTIGVVTRRKGFKPYSYQVWMQIGNQGFTVEPEYPVGEEDDPKESAAGMAGMLYKALTALRSAKKVRFVAP